MISAPWKASWIAPPASMHRRGSPGSSSHGATSLCSRFRFKPVKTQRERLHLLDEMVRGDLGQVEAFPVVVQEPGEGVGHRLRLVVICARPHAQPFGVAHNRHVRKQALAQDCANAEAHVQSMQVRSRQH